MPVTLAQVAAAAGVSQPTASRVLNGSERTPAPDVAASVRKAADELGYIANAQAQALVRSTSGLLGLVVHDISDPYFSAIASGVERAAEEHDRQVMLAVTGRNPERELAAVQTFIAHRADAVVLAGSQWSSRRAATVRKRLKSDIGRFAGPTSRVAMLGPALPHTSAVAPENRKGAAALAEALVADGTREFIVLQGPPDLVTARDRTAGFVGVLESRGIVPKLLVPGDLSRDGGFDAAEVALDFLSIDKGRPTCIFAVTDVMAIGAAAALRKAGLRVPDDVHLAGFDDIETLRDHIPALTTVRLPIEEMGYRAAVLALTEGAPAITESVPGEVVLRESTGHRTHPSP